jgi:hypothetical protein
MVSHWQKSAAVARRRRFIVFFDFLVVVELLARKIRRRMFDISQSRLKKREKQFFRCRYDGRSVCRAGAPFLLPPPNPPTLSLPRS